MDWKTLYKDLRALNWSILLILSTVSYFLMSHPFTMGITLGGLIIIANFNVLQHTIRRAFSSDRLKTTHKISVLVKYYLRLLALGVILFFLITKGWADPIGLAVGLSTVVISIVSFGINRAMKTMTGEAT